MAAALTMRLTNNDNTDSFKSEDEALEWLDGRMAAFLAKRAALAAKGKASGSR
jgi:hypothetical protein